MNTQTITPSDLAEIIGVAKTTVLRRATKENWPFENGSNRTKMFLISGLPEDIRADVITARSEKQLSLLYKDMPSVEKSTDIVPFSSDRALQVWRKKPASCQDEARTRLGMVNKARSIKARNNKGKTKALKRYGKSQGVSLATLNRYLKTADEAMKAAQDNGGDVVMAQIMALTPDYGRNRGASRAFSREAIDYALSIYSTQQHLNISDVHKNTVNEGKVAGWRVGSYHTLKRIIDKELTVSARKLAREGVHRYQADCELKILRDYREIWPNFMWCGDHHIFDVFVKHGGKVLRPWVTAWMDMASRSFMGWCISFQPNSRTIALALAHGIARKDDERFPQHGLPSSVYIDNGKDYRSKYLNGEKISIGPIDYPEIIERFASLGIDPFYIDLKYDPTDCVWKKERGTQEIMVKSMRIGGVYARLNIHQRYAKTYHPWGKPIERAFRNVVQGFSRQQPGWCGSGHEQRPEKLTWELKSGQILTYREFCERFYSWVVDDYHTAPHTGHGMDGRSPNEVFEAFGAPELVDPEILSFALLKKEQVKIHNWGFNLNGEKLELDVPGDLSGAAILNKTINRWATVLYDPELRNVRVYVDGRFMCMARLLRRASFIRPDDPVLKKKLRLQGNQRKLNDQTLKRIQEQAPKLLGGSDVEALLELSGCDDTETIGEHAPAVDTEPIPLTAEARYRAILRKEAGGKSISEADLAWRDDYEQTDEYDQMRALYEAEFTYMQHQERREAL